MDEQPLKRVCAWCSGIMADGREPATHGICPDCLARMERPDDLDDEGSDR